MIVTIFRSRLNANNTEAYARWAQRMSDLATTMSGYVSHKGYVAEDGERVTIVEFETEDQQRAWARHPEHRQAQDLGREAFYTEYRVQVCQELRGHRHRAAA